MNNQLAIGQRLKSARMLTTSNEKEISHGKVLWQTLWTDFAAGP
jgi:hypothetical protein